MKKIVYLAIALILIGSIAGCGNRGGNTDPTVLNIGASASPHAEILEFVKPMMEERGITMNITVFNDFVQPNVALHEGDIDANYFQHVPYLDSFNEARGWTLTPVGAVHYEPLGIYPGRTTSLDELQDGAQIAIPNDPTNGARALLLLEYNGLITLDPTAGIAATVRDITDNPMNLTITEMEAAQIPRALQDVDLAVINGNFAMQAGMNVKDDALAFEDPDSPAAQTYKNVIVVRYGEEDNKAVRILLEVLHSEEVRNFIDETYRGAVVPIF